MTIYLRNFCKQYLMHIYSLPLLMFSCCFNATRVWFPASFRTKIDSNLHVFAYSPLTYTWFSRFVLSSASEKPASTSATSVCLVRFCICFDTRCCLAGLLSCCFDTFPLLGHLFVPSLPRVFILARDFRSLFSLDCFLSHSDLYLFVVIKELARGRTLSPSQGTGLKS